MKKLFALLLAAMMILASVSALAEGETSDSVKPSDTTTTASPIFVIVPLGPVGEQYRDQMIEAEEKGEPVTGVFTPEVQDALKEIVGENGAVHEMFGLTAPGWDPSMGAQYLILEFATEYKAGEPVSAVLVLVNGEGEDARITENVLMAEVPEDYKVQVYLPLDMLNDLVSADESFVIIVSANDAE